MSYVSFATKLVSQLLKPSFYEAQYFSGIRQLQKISEKNAAAPLFYAMGAIGVVGYAMKYVILESK